MMCCLCRAIGIEVHHIVPEAENGDDSDENAAPLCPSCHETYGANPTKRKFIREARDLWYEICAKRYAPDTEALADLQAKLEEVATKRDLDALAERLRTMLGHARKVEERATIPAERQSDRILGIESDIVERALTLLTELFPLVDTASLFLEIRAGSSSIGAVVQQRDAVSHLVTLLRNKSLSRDERLAQIGMMEEHLRRGVVEPYTHAAAKRVEQFQQTLLDYEARVCRLPKHPALAGATSIATLRAAVSELQLLVGPGGPARTTNRWTTEVEEIVRAFERLDTYEAEIATTLRALAASEQQG